MTFYTLTCLECLPPLPMPFASAAERGKWAAEHTSGTGHDRWIVRDESAPGGPPLGGDGKADDERTAEDGTEHKNHQG